LRFCISWPDRANERPTAALLWSKGKVGAPRPRHCGSEFHLFQLHAGVHGPASKEQAIQRSSNCYANQSAVASIARLPAIEGSPLSTSSSASGRPMALALIESRSAGPEPNPQ
jgi:hypothetical protein